MKNRFTAACAALLTLLFVYAAISKLIVFDDFKGQLLNQPFPHWLARVLLFALPAVELAAAYLLVIDTTRRMGFLVSAILMLFFTGYIGLVLLHVWDRVPCSCGGVLSKISWQGHFIFNLFFLSLAVAGLSITKKGESRKPSKRVGTNFN